MPGSLRLGNIVSDDRPRSISADDGSLASTGVARMFRSASCMSLDFVSVFLMYRIAIGEWICRCIPCMTATPCRQSQSALCEDSITVNASACSE